MEQKGKRADRPGGRRLTPEQRRRILLARRRKQRRRRRLMLGAGALAAVLVAAVVLALTLRGGRADAGADAQPVAAALAQAAPEDGGAEADAGLSDAGEDSSDAAEAGEGPGPVAETSAPTADAGSAYAAAGEFVFDEAYVSAALGEVTGPLLAPDLSAVDPAKLDRWPEVTEGYMPITKGAQNVTENVIAITVDDCYQGGNLRQIVQCALDNGAKLTLFPIGANLELQSVGPVVKWAWENGMEIENHTYDHVGNYHYEDGEMERQIWSQGQKLNEVLGVRYQQHFFRPKGGDERVDQRTHAYIRQLGMYAVALWGASGTSNVQTSIQNLAPGQVYLFHTTDKDLAKLLYFIPYAVQQGYRLVTLNEMFGLPDNEVGELGGAEAMPALEPFRIIPARLQKTSYVRAAAVVQKRLIELGWLEGEADGVFGDSSYMATGYFQQAAGLKADGVAGPETQAVLFAQDAPRKQ